MGGPEFEEWLKKRKTETGGDASLVMSVDWVEPEEREWRFATDFERWCEDRKLPEERPKPKPDKVRPSKSPAKGRAFRLKSKYGITAEDFEFMLEWQDGKCAICQKPMEQICIDHNHETGEVRALLCRYCNLGIGFFKENLTVMERAMDYIRNQGLGALKSKTHQ